MLSVTYRMERLVASAYLFADTYMYFTSTITTLLHIL